MGRERLPLPVIDQARTEFGAPRTRCGCQSCVAYCHTLPGYLIPADLTRMIPPDADPRAWAEENLRASPGALVGNVATGERWRIPTLVPARTEGGACIHLDGEERCRIHAVSPFGCAFFDHHRDGQSLTRHGLTAVAHAQQDPSSLYRRLWVHLELLRLTVPPPEEGRQKLKEYLAARRPGGPEPDPAPRHRPKHRHRL
jgi:hypothetical protein